MSSFFSDKQLQEIKRRIKRGVDPDNVGNSENRSGIVKVAFAAYCYQSANRTTESDKDLCRAMKLLFGLSIGERENAFPARLLAWMKENLQDIRLKGRFRKYGTKKFIHDVKVCLNKVDRENRQHETDIIKQREKRKQQTAQRQQTERRIKAYSRQKQQQNKEEALERERYDMKHPLRVTHKVRLMPNKLQTEYLSRCIRVEHLCYNWALQQWLDARSRGESVDADTLLRRFNDIKHVEYPETTIVFSRAAGSAFSHFHRAQRKFFDSLTSNGQIATPQAKDPDDIKGSFFFVPSGGRCKLIDDCNPNLPGCQPSRKRAYLRIPDLGYVKMAEKPRFNGRIAIVTIKREADGHFYACIGININHDEWQRTHEKTSFRNLHLGIDIGVKHFATTSSGLRIDNPDIYKDSLPRKRILYRSLSRKQKGSSNYKKDCARLAKFEVKIANRRRDFMHKVTHAIAYHYYNVSIETLGVTDMMKHNKTAGYMGDVAPYTFRTLLQQKQKALRTHHYAANRFYPSTQICSVCGKRGPKLTLEQRTFVCRHCGAVIDRDLNAAINLANLIGLGGPGKSSAESAALMKALKKAGIKSHRIETESD